MKYVNCSKIIACIIACVIMLMYSVPVFAANTTNEMSVVSTANNYNETIKMTDEQVLEYFEEFMAYCPSIVSTEDAINPEVLNDFAQYAVEEGIIENTVQQRAAISKSVVRASFAAVVTAGELAGLDTAADFLEHSLQDTPSNLSYASTSSYANQILNSSECKKIISDFKAYVKGKNLVGRSTSGSTTLNSTTDLHLAYNKVSYNISGIKRNGVWTLTIKFKDTYDFEKQAWKNAMTDNVAVTALNNYAAYAQDIGAIVPYNITVTVKTTFTE